MLFSFIAGCTDKIGFAPGVLILAQRQAVLVAKQAASLDELSNGRLRLGVGVGWNELEFTGLNENFHNRGKRSEEQVQVMQALWANPHVDLQGQVPHDRRFRASIRGRNQAGCRSGSAAMSMRRCERTAKWGDGWMPLAYPADDTALAAFDKLRSLTRAAGRDPADVGIEVWMSLGAGDEADWRKEVTFWKKAGVTHVTAHTARIRAAITSGSPARRRRNIWRRSRGSGRQWRICCRAAPDRLVTRWSTPVIRARAAPNHSTP